MRVFKPGSGSFIREHSHPIVASQETTQDVASPATLRRQADEKRALARRLEADADNLDRQADDIEIARARSAGLTESKRSGKVNTMLPAHRQARSEAAVESDDEFMATIHAAGYPSMRALARRLGITAAFLSQVRAGDKKMPVDLGRRIERLTGYPASRWPA